MDDGPDGGGQLRAVVLLDATPGIDSGLGGGAAAGAGGRADDEDGSGGGMGEHEGSHPRLSHHHFDAPHLLNYVETKDGYLLSIQHVYHGKTTLGERHGPSVFLQHGLFRVETYSS
ncbi:hypothetical protein ZIOFF_030260 [Zingiber officinale]|uniref:Partial AB-hydrolase lipase domain-containing protein n=1 Tax=Zingiber officinale TaxID=94328 RepID=A0A8J5GQV5_ZINOF|nr:hypothetical protein ZIOFF_030260 [Zingiber officinale]